MATRTKKNPYHVMRAAGTKIKPDHQRVLDEVARRVFDEYNVAVLNSLFAKVPGHANFFATAFVNGMKDSLPPFGVLKVCFLNNGSVTARLMGLREGQYETVKITTKHK